MRFRVPPRGAAGGSLLLHGPSGYNPKELTVSLKGFPASQAAGRTAFTPSPDGALLLAATPKEGVKCSQREPVGE